MVRPRPGWSDVDDDHADHEGERRHRLEIEQRPDADASDLLHRAHVRDADDHGRKHDRGDQHLHELDEPVAERPHRRAPFSGATNPRMTPAAMPMRTWT